MGVNKVIAIGNLGRDPEVRYTQGGQAVCKFSIAVNEKWRDKEGEQHERVEWIRIVAFGKLGENCGQYLAKGRPCYVEGKLSTSQYEKEGQTHYSTEVIAQNVQFLGGGQGGGRQQQRSDSGGGSGQAPPASDDIPF